MITVYFRESPNGSLHGFQSAGSTALRPFEIAANRIARPFHDAYNWTADVFHAKAENKQLKQVRLRLGVSDGTNIEIVDGPPEVKEGVDVVTNVIIEQPSTPGANNANNPLLGPQRGRGPGGPGGPGGGGGGGGRGGGR